MSKETSRLREMGMVVVCYVVFPIIFACALVGVTPWELMSQLDK